MAQSIIGLCVSMLFNCKCYFQIPENAKFNKKGTKKWIEKVYNGIAYEEGLDYDVGFDEMLRVLFEHGYYEEVELISETNA